MACVVFSPMPLTTVCPPCPSRPSPSSRDSVVWHACPVPNCDHRTKRKSNLKQHLADRHGVEVVWHACPVPGCDHRAKQKSDIKKHLAFKHGIGVVWHACPVPGCDYRAKQKGDIKQHRADRHDIGVVWHACPEPDCDYRAKQKSNLKQHLAFKHDIGKHKCDYCHGNRNSSIPHRDPALKTTVKICRKCFNKTTGKNSRVELKWSEHLDAALGTDFLLGSDRSLRGLGGCSRKRPDKLYASPDRVIVGECDEHQHNRSNGSYTCEEQRLSELYDEPSIAGKPMAVIRWNPDAYAPPTGTRRKNRKERLALFVALHERLSARPPAGAAWPPIAVYYMFYDEDNPKICRNLPTTLIYDMDGVRDVSPAKTLLG